MLVISRKLGEGFQIGPDVHVVVTDIRGDKVRVGIEAPTSIRVVRDEIAHLPPRGRDTGEEGEMDAA